MSIGGTRETRCGGRRAFQSVELERFDKRIQLEKERVSLALKEAHSFEAAWRNSIWKAGGLSHKMGNE